MTKKKERMSCLADLVEELYLELGGERDLERRLEILRRLHACRLALEHLIRREATHE